MTHIDAARGATVGCPFCATLNRVDLTRVGDRPKCGSCGRPILLDRPLGVTDQSFDRVIADAEVPVLVDFYADWCGPCKVMAPVLDEVARDQAGRVLVLKMDTDRHRATAMRFGIRGIPTLVAFVGGRETARDVGVVSRAKLDALVASLAPVP
jgi:thioredoxin 2